MTRRVLPSPAVLALACALAACAPYPQTAGTTPAATLPGGAGPGAAPAAATFAAPGRVAMGRLTLPSPAARQFRTAGDAGAELAGVAGFQAAQAPYLHDSAARFRLSALAPAGHAFVVLASPTGEIYVRGGAPITATANAAGRFDFGGRALAEGPFLISATIAASHALNALAWPGATAVAVDEASSMVAELARFQIAPADLPGRMSPERLDALYQDTLAVLDPADFTAGLGAADAASFQGLDPNVVDIRPEDLPTPGPVPAVAALKHGNGHVLRNAYVRAFGSRIATAGAGVADRLSDAWREVLGFRPLALTRLAGNGVPGFSLSEHVLAAQAPLNFPLDAVANARGDVYITELGLGQIRCVPAALREAGLLARRGEMRPGHVYTVVGNPAVPIHAGDFNALYRPFELASVALPAAAPDVATGFPILQPHRLRLEAAGDADHLFFTTLELNRVMLVPATPFRRFGRDFHAGRLYTIAGTGELPAGPADYLGDPPAHQARLAVPTGLAGDSRGNLYVLDASGAIRLIRATNDGPLAGTATTLPVLQGEQPLLFPGAHDIRVVESQAGNFLFVAATNQQVIVRVPLPADLTALDGPLLAAMALDPSRFQAQIVVGRPGQAGVLDTTVPGAEPPDQLTINHGVDPRAVLLDAPASLDFDAAGNLLFVDRNRLRVLDRGDGLVYTLGGGFVGTGLEGDARIASYPDPWYLNVEPGSGNVLLVERAGHVVRKLWTARGVR